MEEAICKLCGHPMPKGEEMFHYHGYSGPCPEPTLKEKPMDKLAGNQNVRKTAGPGNGQFAKETERNDPERVVETDPEKEDPYVATMAQLAKNYKASGGGSAEFQSLIQFAVNGANG